MGQTAPRLEPGDERPSPLTGFSALGKNIRQDTLHLANSMRFRGVPRYVVPVGKNINAPWTRCHALEPELILSMARLAMHATSSRAAQALQAVNGGDGCRHLMSPLA